MAILKAGKSETNNAQNLISSVTRGGLWLITQPAQKVFWQTELIFREFSSLDGLKQVDIPSIICKSVTDSTILTQYGTMVSEADLQPIFHVTKSVLLPIVCCIVSSIFMFVSVHFHWPKTLLRSARSMLRKPRLKLFAKKLVGNVTMQRKTDKIKHTSFIYYDL